MNAQTCARELMQELSVIDFVIFRHVTRYAEPAMLLFFVFYINPRLTSRIYITVYANKNTCVLAIASSTTCRKKIDAKLGSMVWRISRCSFSIPCIGCQFYQPHMSRRAVFSRYITRRAFDIVVNQPV